MKIDLTNINGLADVEAQVKTFEEKGKNITETPRLKNLRNGMKEIKKVLADYDKADAETELPDASWEEKRRYEELIESKKKELMKKNEAYKKEESQIIESKEYKEEVKKQETDLREEKSAFYTQTKMKFEREQAKIKHEMQGILLQLGEPDVSNAADLNLQYNKYQDKLAELNRAIAMCNEQKAKVVAEFAEAVKPINDILKETYGETVKDDQGKDDQGKDNPGKDDPGKDDPGKDDQGKDDPGKDNPEKDDPGKDDQGKGNPPAKIDGKRTYQSLGFWNRYKMKRDAFAVSEGLQPNEKIALVRKFLLMLPSNKYSAMAARMISNGDIKAPEGTKIPKETEQPKVKTEKSKMEKPSMWGDLTPEQQAEINKNIKEMIKNKKQQDKEPAQQQNKKTEHTK